MGLRLRLNLLLSVIFVATLGVGSAVLLNVLQQGIEEELTASVDQAAKLISVVVNQLPADISDRKLQETLNDIVTVGSTRHLRISTDPYANTVANSEQLAAPRWFFSMLAPDPVGLLRVIDLRSKQRQLVVRADATAEINEAWREAVPLFLTLLLFGLLANGLIYFFLGRSLAALERVGGALQEITGGDFTAALPAVGVTDIDKISSRVNELSADLQRSKTEARTLARRSLTIQEQERRDLAQALHDQLGQSINAIKALGVSIKQRSEHAAEIRPSVESIIDASTDMYEHVRDMMTLLRPSVLDELGFRLALENMIDDWNSHHEDVFCQLWFDESVGELDENQSINLYRIVQEALTNVVKHSDATEVKVHLKESLELDGECLMLDIHDNGIGFDIDAVTKGLGMHGIEERVEALNGTLVIESGQQGTHYSIKLPVGDKEISDSAK